MPENLDVLIKWHQDAIANYTKAIENAKAGIQTHQYLLDALLGLHKSILIEEPGDG